MSEPMDPACETLVEAIMRLCDPKLLDAVARAEASQSDAMLLERELPRLQPKPQDQANRPTVDKCDFLTAWGLLLADFAGQIDGRKVFLRGVPFSPIAKTVVETIPNAWATQMSIYPGSAVVEAAGLRFVSVRVSYQEPLAADAKLPLAQAITRWSSADLVKAVMEAEQRYIPHHLNEFYRQAGGVRRRLLRNAEVQQPGKDNGMGRPSYEWLTVAWMDLEADFRERLASSIFLDGVKIEPELEVESRPIPQAWASAAKIEVSNGTVTLGKMRYSGVTASLQPPAQEGQAEGGAAEAHDTDQGTRTGTTKVRIGSVRPDETRVFPDSQTPLQSVGHTQEANAAIGMLIPTTASHNAAVDIALASPARHKRRNGGRRSDRPYLIDALRAHWDIMFPKGAPAHPGPWTNLSRRLIRRMKANPLVGNRLPAEETVRKHLPDIYAQVLGEKGGAGSINQ